MWFHSDCRNNKKKERYQRQSKIIKVTDPQNHLILKNESYLFTKTSLKRAIIMLMIPHSNQEQIIHHHYHYHHHHHSKQRTLTKSRVSAVKFGSMVTSWSSARNSTSSGVLTCPGALLAHLDASIMIALLWFQFKWCIVMEMRLGDNNGWAARQIKNVLFGW